MADLGKDLNDFLRWLNDFLKVFFYNIEYKTIIDNDNLQTQDGFKLLLQAFVFQVCSTNFRLVNWFPSKELHKH